MPNVLVTGGSRGIGAAIVAAFAARADRVAFVYNRSEKEARALVKTHQNVSAFFCDLADRASVLALPEMVEREFGEVDVLINNAGVSLYSLAQDVSPEAYDRLMNVNFAAPFFLTRAFLPAMIRKQSGVILNIASIWGQTGASMETLYSASKGALIAFTKALAKETAPCGVRVNAIAPGAVDTEMLASFSAEEKDLIRREIPTERFVSPEEIARLALFLCCEEIPGLTGQIVGINGGQY